MRLLRTLSLLALLSPAWPGSPVSAHPLAPVLLDLREQPDGTTLVTWKTPLVKPAGGDIRPRLPEDCRPLDDAEVSQEGEARTVRWAVRCGRPWVDRTVAVEGLDESDTNAIVRVSLAGGRLFRALLSREHLEVTIPRSPSRLRVVADYLALGIEHLLTGLDHVAFVLGLMLLVGRGRLLLWTITAFTLGHSLTLSAAVLGLVHVPAAPVEASIAASILVLAAAIASPARPRPSHFARRPWLVASGFGLLHGLGFAGALAETGVPAEEIPLALLSFNVGIELGQIAIVVLALGAARLSRIDGRRTAGIRMAIAYGIGSLAAYWVFERIAPLVR